MYRGASQQHRMRKVRFCSVPVTVSGTSTQQLQERVRKAQERENYAYRSSPCASRRRLGGFRRGTLTRADTIVPQLKCGARVISRGLKRKASHYGMHGAIGHLGGSLGFGLALGGKDRP